MDICQSKHFVLLLYHQSEIKKKPNKKQKKPQVIMSLVSWVASCFQHVTCISCIVFHFWQSSSFLILGRKCQCSHFLWVFCLFVLRVGKVKWIVILSSEETTICFFCQIFLRAKLIIFRYVWAFSWTHTSNLHRTSVCSLPCCDSGAYTCPFSLVLGRLIDLILSKEDKLCQKDLEMKLC